MLECVRIMTTPIPKDVTVAQINRILELTDEFELDRDCNGHDKAKEYCRPAQARRGRDMNMLRAGGAQLHSPATRANHQRQNNPGRDG